VSEQEATRANAEALERRLVVQASDAAVRRLSAERVRVVDERLAAIAALDRQRAVTSRELAAARARMQLLERTIALRKIRAPIAGRLAGVYDLQTGSVLEKGSAVAAVVPSGELRIVANFAAASALGRVRPGQNAWLRLDGFPWTEYGKLRALVDRVATEASEGKVRVELSAPTLPSHVSHGLAASVEVEVERLSPAELIGRVATRKFTGMVRSLREPSVSEPQSALDPVR
jgi:membrane fusion protein (multidrug efflux system)